MQFSGVEVALQSTRLPRLLRRLKMGGRIMHSSMAQLEELLQWSNMSWVLAELEQALTGVTIG